MIRHQIRLDEELQKHEAIEAEDGEVIGRKGSVARLAQLFRNPIPNEFIEHKDKESIYSPATPRKLKTQYNKSKEAYPYRNSDYDNNEIRSRRSNEQYSEYNKESYNDRTFERSRARSIVTPSSSRRTSEQYSEYKEPFERSRARSIVTPSSSRRTSEQYSEYKEPHYDRTFERTRAKSIVTPSTSRRTNGQFSDSQELYSGRSYERNLAPSVVTPTNSRRTSDLFSETKEPISNRTYLRNRALSIGSLSMSRTNENKESYSDHKFDHEINVSRFNNDSNRKQSNTDYNREQQPTIGELMQVFGDKQKSEINSKNAKQNSEWYELPERIYENKYQHIEEKGIKIDEFRHETDSVDGEQEEEEEEENVIIESWEEYHTVPIETLPKDITKTVQTNNNIFPNKETALQHILSIRKNNTNQPTWERKSLAEILSEYQTKGYITPGQQQQQQQQIDKEVDIDFPIKRNGFIIENHLDTTSPAKTIDIVTGCYTPTTSVNNPFQYSFHVAKENPIYSNLDDWQDTLGKSRLN